MEWRLYLGRLSREMEGGSDCVERAVYGAAVKAAGVNGTIVGPVDERVGPGIHKRKNQSCQIRPCLMRYVNLNN